MVIQELLPQEIPACFPQLTRMGAPQRFGGGLTQKPSEDSNLPGILWVGVGNEEWRWRVEYKSFEAYLKEKFPDSRRKAYYLMSIHDHRAQIPAPEIEALGWSKAMELAKVARSEGRQFDCATWLNKAQESTKQELKEAVHKYFTGGRLRTLRDGLLQAVRESVAGGGKGALCGDANGGDGALAGILPGTGVCGFSGGQGRGIFAGGDLDGDSPPGASVAGGLSGATCRAEQGQRIGNRRKMLTKVKRVKLGRQIYRRFLFRVRRRSSRIRAMCVCYLLRPERERRLTEKGPSGARMARTSHTSPRGSKV